MISFPEITTKSNFLLYLSLNQISLLLSVWHRNLRKQLFYLKAELDDNFALLFLHTQFEMIGSLITMERD